MLTRRQNEACSSHPRRHPDEGNATAFLTLFPAAVRHNGIILVVRAEHPPPTPRSPAPHPHPVCLLPSAAAPGTRSCGISSTESATAVLALRPPLPFALPPRGREGQAIIAAAAAAAATAAAGGAMVVTGMAEERRLS